MIPSKVEGAVIDGTFDGEKVDMKLDLSKMAHFMNILTDLYEDGELACIREYSTNALDSHAMAGVDKPIEVFLPTPLRRTLEIQDYGLGMSYDDIKETYGTYGASTKTTEAAVNGYLGLGSKSALTYTNMFGVRAVKDNVKTEVQIYRDERGAGTIEIIDTREVDEPNSVRIIIPVKSTNQITEKAERFFATWKPGTVRLDGAKLIPVEEHKDAFWLDSKTLIVPKTAESSYLLNASAQRSKTYIVMGNVAYPITSQYGSDRNYITYYFADISVPELDGESEIDFVPSREALNNNTKTNKVVEKVWANSNAKALIDYVSVEINSAKNLDEAWAVWKAWWHLHDQMRNHRFHYGTTRLVDGVSYDQKRFDPHTSDPSQFTDKVSQIKVDHALKSLFILDKPDDRPFTHKAKAQAREYVRQHKIEGYVYFGPPPENKLFAKAKTCNWNDIISLEVKVEYNKNPEPRKKADYNYYYGAQSAYNSSGPVIQAAFDYKPYHAHTAKKIPKPDAVVYLVGSIDSYRYSMRTHYAENSNVQFVYLTERRVNRLLRENPEAVSFDDWVKKKIDKLPNLTDLEKEFLALSKESREIVDACNLASVKDKKIKDFASVNRQKVAEVSKKWYNLGKDLSQNNKDYIRQTYPLSNVHHLDHTVIYIKGILSNGS